MKNLFPFLALFLCLSQAKSQNSQNADEFTSDVARDWFRMELVLIKTGTGFTPPVAARALGYSGLALYQAVEAGIPGYGSLESVLPNAPDFANADTSLEYHWPAVANNAMALIIDSLFANANAAYKDSIHNLRDLWNGLFQVQLSPQTYNDSKALGEQIAQDIFDYSRTDGGHKGYLTNTNPNYIPPTGPGKWEPTYPAYGMAVQPYWGNVRPFVAENCEGPCIPTNPPSFSTDTNSAFYAYNYQVYATGNNLSQGQKNIARYWADGGGTVTPPGHSVSILSQILKKENADLAFAARAYAMLGMSQMDAFISAWKTKYIYNLMRPITYIRAYIDPNWTSFISTPPFPEYASGHSTQSGAMTSVMNQLFGYNYSFTDSTNGALHGGPRTFASFDEAAYEAATSRLYGGIHYEFSDVLAISLGKQMGTNIINLFESVRTFPIGIQEHDLAFSLYPNPTANYVLMSYEGFTIDRVEVMDLQGRIVMVSENPFVTDLSFLDAGIYVLKAYDQDSVIASQQVIKQ